jgi:hypothetical protein
MKPVIGMAAVVRHREDPYEIVGSPIDEAIRVLLKHVTACPRFMAGPAERRRGDLLDGVVEISEEALLGRGTLLPVPIAGFLDFPGGLGMEDQSRGHGVRA